MNLSQWKWNALTHMCWQQVQQERESAEALAGQAVMDTKDLLRDQMLSVEQAKKEGGSRVEHVFHGEEMNTSLL